MFKTGNIVRFKDDEAGKFYPKYSGELFEVLTVHFHFPAASKISIMVYRMKNLKTGEIVNVDDNHFELDILYMRQQKLKKICGRI